MEINVVEVLTAKILDSKAVFSLKMRTALMDTEKKALECFYEDFESVKKVIPEAERDFRKGIACYILGKFDEAEKLFDKATSGLYFLLKLQNLIAMDCMTAARKMLPKLLASISNEQDQSFLLYATLLACDLRDNDSARTLLGKLNLVELGKAGLFISSYVAELEGEYQKALDGYRDSVEENHELLGQAIFRLARLYDMRGFDEEALGAYRQIETLGFSFEEAFVNMGVILEDRQEFSEAITYYEKALKVNPQNKRALLYHEDAEASLNMHYDEKKRKQDLKTVEILNIPISDFELSVRSRNCLSKMGIFTLKHLITKTETELMGYKNFGETSLKEIRAMLAKKGLHLGMTRVDEAPLAERIKMNAQLYSQEKHYQLDELDTPIENLDLSYRTKSALHKMGFESLRDITMRTGTDLESNEKFSAACLQEVNAMLEEKGYGYRPATSSGKPDSKGDQAGDFLLGSVPDDDNFED